MPQRAPDISFSRLKTLFLMNLPLLKRRGIVAPFCPARPSGSPFFSHPNLLCCSAVIAFGLPSARACYRDPSGLWVWTPAPGVTIKRLPPEKGRSGCVVQPNTFQCLVGLDDTTRPTFFRWQPLNRHPWARGPYPKSR